MNILHREEKPFVPNPKSKTPLTDEMLFNVRKILKEDKDECGTTYAKEFVTSFTVPSEKEDIIAMYLACKANYMWDKKRDAIAKQMQTLFKNDPDVIKVLGLFAPNPNSKTPLTDELLFNFKKLRDEHSWDSKIEEYITSFKIPEEKEDIIAMYLACKTNKTDRFDKWEKKQKAIATQMQVLFKEDSDIKALLKADKLWVEVKQEPKPFVPNPDSKTPITDELMFHVRRLKRNQKSDSDIEKSIVTGTIPTEKEDIVAMYIACKANNWGTKKAAVLDQMKILFKNDPDIKGIIEDEETMAAKAAEAERKAAEEARLRREEEEAEAEKKKADEKKQTIVFFIVFVIIMLFLYIVCY